MAFFFLEPKDTFLIKRYVGPSGDERQFFLIKSHRVIHFLKTQLSAILFLGPQSPRRSSDEKQTEGVGVGVERAPKSLGNNKVRSI